MNALIVAPLLCALAAAGGAGNSGPSPEASSPILEPPRDNVAVHVVQKKRFADRDKHELSLYPLATQVNGKYTEHVGTALSYTYHLQENFALQLLPQYNWYTADSAFSRELIDKVSQEPVAATSLLLEWAIQGGVEVAPLYGKFAVGDAGLVHFSLIVNAGAGIGSTRHQLKPANASGPSTFGDTGLRLVGSVGGGFRVQLGDRFAIRLELRDLLYSARVTRVNGCSAADLSAMLDKVDQGQSVSSASVGSGCDVRRFDGIDRKSNYNRSNDIPLALNLVGTPSADVLNNLGLYAGLSFLF